MHAHPVHGLPELLERPSRLPWACLAGGLVGGHRWALQVWTSAHDWPLNVGGVRELTPASSQWVAFESDLILLAGLGGGRVLPGRAGACGAAGELPRSRDGRPLRRLHRRPRRDVRRGGAGAGVPRAAARAGRGAPGGGDACREPARDRVRHPRRRGLLRRRLRRPARPPRAQPPSCSRADMVRFCWPPRPAARACRSPTGWSSGAPPQDPRPGPDAPLEVFGPGPEEAKRAGDVLANPVPVSPAAIARGEKVFRAWCARRHGVSGGRGDGAVTSGGSRRRPPCSGRRRAPCATARSSTWSCTGPGRQCPPTR